MTRKYPPRQRHKNRQGQSVVVAPDQDVLHEVFLPMDDIAYVHTVFAQCFLPYQSVKQDAWKVDHGRASILVEAGSLIDPSAPNQFVKQRIPSGAKARILLTHIQTEAVQKRTRIIDMGHSMRQFMKRSGVKDSGSAFGSLTREVHNLAAASISVAGWGDTHAASSSARIASSINFWLEKDERQFTIWQPELEISRDFYAILQEHRMAIPWSGYIGLQDDPRAQDIYMWMCYRLPKIPANKPLLLEYKHLNGIFGNDSNEFRFWEKFRASTISACKWYPQARVQFLNDCVKFHQAPPAVPPARKILHLS